MKARLTMILFKCGIWWCQIYLLLILRIQGELMKKAINTTVVPTNEVGFLSTLYIEKLYTELQMSREAIRTLFFYLSDVSKGYKDVHLYSSGDWSAHNQRNKILRDRGYILLNRGRKIELTSKGEQIKREYIDFVSSEYLKRLNEPVNERSERTRRKSIVV